MRLVPALVLSASLLVMAACNSTASTSPGEGTPSATATASNSPVGRTDSDAGGLTDFDKFRNFALQIQTALASRDTSFFAARVLETSVTCTGSAEPRGACVNQPAGTILRGLPSDITGASALQLVPAADYASAMQTWLASARSDLSDQFGSGAASLYAVGHSIDKSGGADSYLAIISAIYSGRGRSDRQALVLRFQLIGGSWRLVGEERAVNPGTPEQWLSGTCTKCYDEWELFPQTKLEPSR